MMPDFNVCTRERAARFAPGDAKTFQRHKQESRSAKRESKPCRVVGVMETALYVEELERSARFYQDVFDFATLYKNARCWALSVADQQVLLLFKKGESLLPVATPGGIIPPSEGSGHLHLAFAVEHDELEQWEQKLDEHNVKVESKVNWKRGGASLYFRDHDQHLIELVTRGCWSIY